ncbi:MAG: S8 family serine peptidase [Oligoflexia bacterium]|nr:S8 family serine peptidase [Oligoflexia bacterium]
MRVLLWIRRNSFLALLFVYSVQASFASIQQATEALHLRNWGLDNSSFSSHIEAVKAWKLTKGTHKVVVAVIDTGIDPNHPDLKDNLWHKAGTDEYGYDFVLNKKNPNDNNGHGTHVSGIIGASLKSHNGAAGVAPDISIMAIRYYADHLTSTQILNNIVKAIDYAVDNNADIINISSEGVGFNISEYRAIERAAKKGILVVTAAGNKSESNDNKTTASYPASYDLPNIISVAATNIQNKLLPTSNFGTQHVHVAAPGENIFSTLQKGAYGYLTGTSQAAAFVSGQAALVLSARPGLKAEEVKKIILSSVDKFDDLKGKVSTAGRINAFKAVELALDLNKADRTIATTRSKKLKVK